MAASDKLYELAGKAKEAEAKLDAAKAEDHAALEAEVDAAKAAASAAAAALRSQEAAAEDSAASWWAGVQESWSDHVVGLRSKIDEKKAERSAEHAARRAERAEDYAIEAVAFAAAAFEEAEYAVLDALLARLEADEAAA